MFVYWTNDEFASNFRRMMSIEQYRCHKIRILLNNYLTGGIIGNAKSLINSFINNTINEDKDIEILASEYFSPIYMLMGLSDTTNQKDVLLKKVEKHIDYYFEKLLI
ncbi:MAG: hypothetical protein LBT75_01515 [Bacilli bacterium]|jgi:hypothetical protein|nr:hypothetical protein [Bacilli bacterium]